MKISLHLIILLMLLFVSCEDLLDMEATSMTIERVTLTKLLFENSSGQNWDELSGPDVFIRFEEENVIGSVETETSQDISPNDLPLVWNMSPKFTLGDYSNDLRVFIYDEDILLNDLIIYSSFEFDPMETPDTWTLEISEDIELTIKVTYDY